MDTWLQFLARHGARISENANPEVVDFGDAQAAAPVTDYVAPLTDLGLIAFSGDDAAHFLHNQLTNDVEHLEASQARLAGYCSPKGRLLATPLLFKAGDAILLALPRAIQPAIQKRLQMFVLRAKVKVTDAGADQVMLGLAGPAASALLATWFAPLPSAPYAKTDSAAGSLIRLADADGVPRYLWIAPSDIAMQAWPRLAAGLQPAGASAWRLSAIRAGIPQITAATQEQFVPQMVNFELVGGVNFRKGCYPGQEIVARSQYLGKLKRRMMQATVAAAGVTAGTEVFSIADREQPCGMIVNAEPVSPSESACLVEVKLAALDAGAIHLGSADGPRLDFLPLPYPLVDPS